MGSSEFSTDKYLDPPGDCQNCADGDCFNGEIVGRDGDGRDLSEPCPCECHLTVSEMREIREEAAADAAADVGGEG